MPDDPDPYPNPKGEIIQEGNTTTTSTIAPSSTERLPRRTDSEEGQLQAQASIEETFSSSHPK
jgi:hypothetical protein